MSNENNISAANSRAERLFTAADIVCGECPGTEHDCDNCPVTKIVKAMEFQLKTVKGNWICSDPDTSQYYRKIDSCTYEYIEIRGDFDFKRIPFEIVHNVIDLRKFSIPEIKCYCSSCYKSLEEIIEHYGFESGLQIMAECIFEQLDNDDELCFYDIENLGTAIRMIHEIMEEF